MRHLSWLAVLSLAAAPVAADVHWIDLAGRGTAAEAEVALVSDRSTAVEIEVVVPGIELSKAGHPEGEFTALEIPGAGRLDGVGRPELPAIRRFVNVPHGARVTIEADVLEWRVVTLANEGFPWPLEPLQLSVPKCDCPEARAWRFSMDEDAYRTPSTPEIATFTGPFGLRDHRAVLATVAPVAYDPMAGTLKIAVRTRVTFRFEEGDRAVDHDRLARLASPAFDSFLGRATVNLRSAGWQYPSAAPIDFMIITPPDWVDELQPFVDWKTSCGYRVRVATTAETGTTTTSIKSFITTLYNSANPPVYILMVGDSQSPLPTYITDDADGGTDLLYVQMDGDLYPDMMIARWPVDNEAELVAMRDKILHYEQPTAANSAWLNRALFLAGNTYISNGVTTHEDVRAELMDPPPNSAETEQWWGDTEHPTTAQLIADLNTGRAWAVYSAHSNASGWEGDPPLSVSDMPSFGNANMYPIAHGHSCQSNMWATNDDVFGEAAVIQANKGFVAYWGGSNSTYWDPDDWLERGFFDSLVESDMASNAGAWDGQFSNVAACYSGLTEVTLQTGGTSTETYYWEIYNLNGDPTLDPFTRAPSALNVGVPPVVPPGANDAFTVTVTDASAGAVPGALVGVTQGGVLLGAGYTDATGVATFHIDAPTPGEDLLVRVTAHNGLPTDETVIVGAGSDGVVVLDGVRYRCDSLVSIDVYDADLAGDGTIQVTLEAVGGASTPVTLTEAPAAGVVQFHGVAVLGTDLAVGHGDILRVTYADADTGSGSGATKTAEAVLDCAGPAISLVQASPAQIQAAVTFSTDEPGTTVVTYGNSMPPGTVVSDPALRTVHEVALTGLTTCTTYHFFVASTDALGNQTSSAPTTFTTLGGAVVDAAATDTPMAIPDDTDPVPGVQSHIVVAEDLAIADVNVILDITHTYDGDLDIYLVGPDGTTVELSTDNGSSGENFTATTFDDEGATPIASGSAPFSGSFVPETPLSALDGHSAAGTWTLTVTDDAGYDTGTLNSWTLHLELDAPCELPPEIFMDGFESGACDQWSIEVPAP